MTKEELIAENARLQNNVASETQFDELRRKEFAKAFGWFKPKRMYDDGTNEPICPTWGAIFIHLGRVLEAASQRDQNQLIMDIDRKVIDMQLKIDGNYEN